MAEEMVDEGHTVIRTAGIHPMDVGLAVEPGELAPGKLARGFLNLADGSVDIHVAFEHVKQLRVPDGFQCVAFPVGEDGLRLGEPTLVHHEVGPKVNAVVQQLARGADAEGQRVPGTPVVPGPAARMDHLLSGLSAAQGAVGLACAAADFQGADHAVGIGPVHGRVVLGIEALQLGEQGSQPF